MQFRTDNEFFDTAEMTFLEVDSLFLGVFLALERELVFLQTFDEDRGVMVRKASPAQTQAILAYFAHTHFQDILAAKEFVYRVTESAPAKVPPTRRHFVAA